MDETELKQSLDIISLNINSMLSNRRDNNDEFREQYIKYRKEFDGLIDSYVDEESNSAETVQHISDNYNFKSSDNFYGYKSRE